MSVQRSIYPRTTPCPSYPPLPSTTYRLSHSNDNVTMPRIKSPGILVLALHTLNRHMTRQPDALLLGISRVRNAPASILAVHGDGASRVALVFEAGADVVAVAAVVGEVVAEVVSAVGDDKGGGGAREEEDNGGELHGDEVVWWLGC